MDLDAFSKVLPLHMKITESVMDTKEKRLFNEDGSLAEVEVQNEVLWDIMQFLYDKLNDIKIDSIRHGLLTEEDYEVEESENE
jgi:hypothetical protein